MKTKQLLEKIIEAESVLSHGDLLCEVTAASILRGCIAALEADIAKPQAQVEPVEYQILILGTRWTHCAKHIYDASTDKSIVRKLHATPQEPAAAGWMPIDVSHPPGDGHYLCATWLKMDMTQTIEICTYRSGTGSFPDAVVTHWVPLPAAPEGAA